MPELPEVETVRRQLEPELVGTTITALAILDPRWSAPLAPVEVADIAVVRRPLAVHDDAAHHGNARRQRLHSLLRLVVLRLHGHRLTHPIADLREHAFGLPQREASGHVRRPVPRSAWPRTRPASR